MRLGDRLFGLVLAGLFAAGACAQEPGAKGQTVRPEIGKPIQAAVDLLKQKKGKEALAKVREVQAVADKTPYETYLVERVIGQAAAAAGENAIAAKAFESVAASTAAPEGERRQFVAAAASQYYLAKNFAKAAELAGRYFKEGGTEKSVRTVYVQALYLGNNFAAAAKELLADVEAEEKAGGVPAEEQLQLLANACLQQRDAAGSAKAMEKLLVYHPKRDYWLNAIHGVVTRPGFSERLAIDVGRLKLETGTMRSADEYLEAAQLSLQEGFPIEAARIIDQGYAAGLLGKGAEADRHRRLKDMAARSLAEDSKALAQDEAQSAASKDAKALFNDGFNYVLHGKFDKGLAMMERGLRDASGFRRPEHTKLQMAYAYHLAGQNQKAIQAFKTVQGTDGAAALARLWAIRLGRTS
jgi:hypothetical protein